MSPVEFLDRRYFAKTTQSPMAIRLILAFVVLTQYQRVTDRQTDRKKDGQTDMLTIATAAFTIAGYADALQKNRM